MALTTENPILLADAYKYSHHKLYYPGTSKIYSYFESRGGMFQDVVFYGLQYYLKQYLEGQVMTKAHVDEAEELLADVFGRRDVFDRSKFDYIVNKHGGRLPVLIKAVPEGTPVPYLNVMLTIESTDPDCFWLSNFLETLLVQLWYPCTVATLSREIKKTVAQAYAETASDAAKGGIDFVLNDFGFRGVSSVESAGLGGSAHLINFMGSDTLMGSVFARRHYAATQMYGKSIPATEHSICTLLGEPGELEVLRHVLNTVPSGLVACVSDSYDILRACSDYWGTALKDQILQRDGTLVIRPDSGDVNVTLKRIFGILFDKFGFTVNDKGYKVLPPQVRVIQGDGIDWQSIQGIYALLKEEKIGAENLVLGMGGALLQKLNRDTQKFAFKCSYATVNGKDVDVQKNPLELDAQGMQKRSFKKSKPGRLKLVQENGQFQTLRATERPDLPDLLQPVFENGKILATTTFEEVRERAAL